MADVIDMQEWGEFRHAVKTLVEGFTEMREEFKDLRKSIGTRCTDCALGDSVADLKSRFEKAEDRLRFLEVKVGGIAVVSGLASAYLMHLLTK